MTAQPAAPVIYGFTGRHRFLSTFYASRLTIEGVGYPAVEHAFQAAKTTDVALRQKIADAPRTARDPLGCAAAKAMGRRLTLRSDWETIKDATMLYIVRLKFHDPELAALLLDTGDAELVEANTWNDRVWGVDRATGVGENRLGRTLMRVRAELQGFSAP